MSESSRSSGGPGGVPPSSTALDAVLGASLAGLAILRGRDLRHERANAAYQAMAPAGPLIGSPLAVCWPALAEALAPRLEQVLLSAGPLLAEPLRLGVPGQPGETWLTVSAQRLPADADEPPGLALSLMEAAPPSAERRQLEEARRFLRALADVVPEPLFLKDLESRWILVNPATLAVAGKTEAEVLGRSDREIYADARIGEALIETDRVVMASGLPRTMEERVQTPQGERTFLSMKAPVRDASGRVFGLVGHARDVTATRLAEALAREKDRSDAMEAAIASLPIGVVVTELGPGDEPRIVTCNSAFVRLVGSLHRNGTALGDLPYGFYRSDRKTPMGPEEGPGARAVRTGEPVLGFEAQLRRADGGWRVLTGSAAPILGGEGPTPRRAITVVIDVTAEREATEALRASEARFRTLVAHLPIGITEADTAGENVYANAACLAIVGRSAEELRASGWHQAVHPGDRDRLLREWTAAVAVGRPYQGDYRLVRPDGTIRSVHGQSVALRDAEGRLTGYLGVIRDATEEREALAAVQESRTRLAAALASMTDAVFISNLDGTFVDFNEAFAAFHRFASKADCARTLAEYPAFLDVYLPDGTLAPLAQWAVPRALRGETATNAEYTLRRKDTGETWIGSYSFAPIRQGGAIVGSVVVGRDVTEQRRAERERATLQAQLAQSQKLESIGRLAGGVAHDFNNLLTVILTLGEDLASALRSGRPASQEDLEEIIGAAQRAAGLTQRLLAFARKQEIEPTTIDLNEHLKESQRLLRRVIGEDVRIELRLAPGLWTVRCDPGLLGQILMNLAVNARDAMPSGGTLTLATENVTLLREEPATGPATPPGPYVRLSVQDTGTGMAPEVLHHLFEPFFTTKPQGQGTGLGLATVYGIATQSGASLRVRSALGVGTTFEIDFPRNGGERSLPASVGGGLKGGTETILVVEDDVSVRAVTVRALRDGGYKVLAAADGEEADRLARGEPGPLHLLLTDVVMPRIGGREVARRLAALRPGLRVLYVSGYTDDKVNLQELRADGHDFLAKPFTADMLRTRIRQVLDRP